MIDRDLIEDIRIANNISGVVSSYVHLRHSGGRLVGLCPFHKEKTPSFHVSDERQFFHCFGCGASGNVITFIMRIENFDFIDAVKFLADRANIIVEEKLPTGDAKKKQEQRNALYEIHRKAARFFYDCLNSDAGRYATEYVKMRDISLKVQRKCGLGYSPNNGGLYSYLKSEGYEDSLLVTSGLIVQTSKGGYKDRFFDRLMFPIFDIAGKIVGFGGRTLSDGIPKYLNSPETPIFEKGKMLYGLNFARESKKKEILITEGYMDAISLYQEGIMNVVASLGTAFTQNQANLLKNYANSVIMLFDSDSAGTNAIYKAIPLLTKVGINVKVAQMVDAKDPDAYIKTFGVQKFLSLMKDAKSNIAWQIDKEREKYNIDASIEDKIGFTKEVSKILKSVQSKVEQDAYIKETSLQTDISEEAIRSEIEDSPDVTPYSQVRLSQARAQRYAESGNAPQKIIKAENVLLCLIAADGRIFGKVKPYIGSEEFTDDVYKRVYEIIAELHAAGKAVNEARIVSYFETLEEQQAAAGLFAKNDQKRPDIDIEKDINDQLRAIKVYAIEKKIKEFTENGDAISLTKALNEQKSARRLYISLSDG